MYPFVIFVLIRRLPGEFNLIKLDATTVGWDLERGYNDILFIDNNPRQNYFKSFLTENDAVIRFTFLSKSYEKIVELAHVICADVGSH